MRTNIERFLERFPKNATNWAQATDEVRDMARKMCIRDRRNIHRPAAANNGAYGLGMLTDRFSEPAAFQVSIIQLSL